MKVVSLKGNQLTVDLNKEEENIFFRAGLQCFMDKEFGKKMKVIPAMEDDISAKEAKHKFEIGDELFNELVKDGIRHALKEGIKQKQLEKKQKAAKKRISKK